METPLEAVMCHFYLKNLKEIAISLLVWQLLLFNWFIVTLLMKCLRLGTESFPNSHLDILSKVNRCHFMTVLKVQTNENDNGL